MACSSQRSDVQIVACEGNEYFEIEEDFYGYSLEDLDGELPSGIVWEESLDDSDEEDPDTSNSGPEATLDIRAAISEVAMTEDNTESFIVPDLEREKLSIQDKLRNGCGCQNNCYKQFTEDDVFSMRLDMFELEKGECDMLLLGKLMVCGHTASSVSHVRKVTANKRQRITYDYSYDSRVSVCRSTFCFIHSISEKVLKNLQAHLRANGPIPRVHGNKGRLPHNTFSFETTEFVVTFILNYAELHGLPLPAAGRGRAEVPPIYLSASDGYNVVHQKYVEACTSKGMQAAKYHAFVGIWQKIVPHVKFMTPRTDVCHYCESYRVQIKHAILEFDKIHLSNKFKEHVTTAQKERARMYRKGSNICQLWTLHV